MLTDRLGRLVEHGVLERVPYREPGSRTRFEYRLTPAGEDLKVVLGALQQWGDLHDPVAEGPTMVRRVVGGTRALHVGFVDRQGREVPPSEARFVPTAAYPLAQ
ncbi:hypothetical protein GCM10025868_10520 [Angustibacter aerolatus]|uniref:HTH hxlR-type domain-containing protein n=1 Tax=Angustibacter aerolatus TaxID=1162965 RepID=A0ABQ6JFV3_9ACTN|nr:helix-turn-helix domain-containing protein [Angustibacter aerolatus]GMA85802.1 hypothetical protein GCM10025868_10520 [Angustibacter aerolatus]